MFLWIFSYFVDYPPTYNNIDCAAGYVWNLEKAMYESNFVGRGNRDIVCLHQNLLDLAAYEKVTQGTFFFAKYKFANRDFVCFQESDSFLGFMHNVCASKLPSSSLLYRAYTAGDVQKRGDYLKKGAASIGSKRSTRNETQGHFTF